MAKKAASKPASKAAASKKAAAKKSAAPKPASQIRPPVVRRMCMRAGVERMTLASVHSVVLEQMEMFVTNIFHAAILRTVSRKIMTVSISDIISAAKVRGITFTPGISANHTPGLTTASFTLPRSAPADGAKTRRQKSGVVRRRLTRVLQRKDALIIYRGNFAAFARGCVSKLKFHSVDVDVSLLRYSRGVMAVAQLLCEKYIIALASAARIIVQASKQQTVNDTHFKTALAIASIAAPFSGVAC